MVKDGDVGGIYAEPVRADVDVDLRHAVVSPQQAQLSLVLFGRSLAGWKWRRCSTTLDLVLLSICSEPKPGPVHLRSIDSRG